MKRYSNQCTLVAVLMFASCFGAIALRPVRPVEQTKQPIGLQTMLPTEFSEWKVDTTITPIMPSVEVEEKISRSYDETLGRTYINAQGERVMLSIAYGGDQTGRLRVHRPESCYTGQGFIVKKIVEQTIQVADVLVPVKRLLAQSGARIEPITYWIRVGDETVTGLIGQRLAQLRFGMTGSVPDGLIFRVSSIGPDPVLAYQVHDRFISELIATLTVDQRAKLVGGSRL